MLADILEDASGSLTSLSLAGNHLDDTAAANIMRALAANGDVQLTHLDLSGNNLLAPVSVLRCAAVLLLAVAVDSIAGSGCSSTGHLLAAARKYWQGVAWHA